MPVLMSGTQRRPFADLLTQTAVRSISALAGHVLSESPEPTRDEALDERPLAPRGALGVILSGERFDCLDEWLKLCGDRRIHPALLPQALEWGKGARLMKAAGPRGHWLVGQNPEWKHHLGEIGGQEVWETGNPRQRAGWLARQAPERAAELLREVWKQENAETRALLLAVVPDLGALELGLADRSKTVRTRAAEGLWRFPEFGLTAEWTGLVAAGQPPQANPGFDLTFSGLGERAGWLAQLAALAPLGPFEAPRGEWREALLQGFTRATLAQGRKDWALGLVRAGVRETELFMLLDWSERDALLLASGPAWGWYGLHRPFSQPLAAKIWRELMVVTQGRTEWAAAQALPALGHGFSVTLELQQGWPEGSPHWRYWNSAVEKLLTLHSFRKAMHEEMA